MFAENGLINIVARNFPPAAWISIALIEYESVKGLIYLVLFIALTVLFTTGFLYIDEKLFLGGYLGSMETSARRGKLDEGQFVREIGVRSKVSAIFWREFRILNRVPIVFLNCVLPVVLVPAILVMMYFTSGDQVLGQLLPLIQSSNGAYIHAATVVLAGDLLALITVGILLKLSILNMGRSNLIYFC